MKALVKIISVLFLITIGIILQISCGQQRQNAPPRNVAKREYKDPYPLPEEALTVNVTGEYGGRLVAASLSDPKTFNPLIFPEETSQTLDQLMNPGLTRLNLKTQEPEPALAKSWESSADNLTWTFHLRQGLQWSDGQPFSAADVLFTMQIVNDPRIPSGAHDALMVHGRGIEWTQLDEMTIVAKLPEVFAPFLRQLDGGTSPILAKHKWEKAYQEGHFAETMQVSMDPREYVSIGPFTLKDYKMGQTLILKRNPYYWKKDKDGRRLPYLDEITFLLLNSQDAIFLKVQNGEIDTHYNIRPENVEGLNQKAASIGIRVIRVGPAYDFEGVFFNLNGGKNPKTRKPYVDPVKRSWFNDLNFRKAVSYGINRNALVQNALYGKGVPAYGPESVGNIAWYNDKILKYDYDPARAAELLKASGFTLKNDGTGQPKLYDKNGNPVHFTLHTNSGNTVHNAECILIASDLAKLGMQVEFTPLDFNTIVTEITSTFDFDAILLLLSHDDTDPSLGMNVWMSRGQLHFWWPMQKSPQSPWEKRIDELMNLQAATFDQAERKKYYDEVQEILAEQQPMIYTVTQYVYVCAKENLGNLQPSVSRHRTLWNADELYWKVLSGAR